ncbi:MAG: pyridoxal-phosphate dependent enzyme [Thermoplasmata archaeon]|nr:pyridoxal-phosphate dependent enzyme [Thermoplasmata archaeon]
MKFVCNRCGKEREGKELFCRSCGGYFVPAIDERFSMNLKENFPYIEEWFSLGEGNTPIIYDDAIFKLEFLSPTLSYKDRGSVTLISSLLKYLKEKNIKRINEDSSGNAGASIAAYGARAGLEVHVYVPENANEFKIKFIESYGAKVHKIKGNRNDVTNAAKNADGFFASHILNPEFRDGMRMISYEIFLALKDPIPRIFVPVSAGTLLLGLIYGFRHLHKSGIIEKMPEIVAAQTEQVSPLCHALKGENYNPPEMITSVADALVSTSPILLDEMLKYMKGQDCVIVNENEIIESRRILLRKGLSVEYSSAVTYAAFRKKDYTGDNIIILTGHGIKSI